MFVLFGTYAFSRKRIGFRNDYCLSCEGHKTSEQWQSFDAIHLFYVPVVPLGNRKRWICASCGNNPHLRVKSSKPLLVMGAIICLYGAVAGWTASLWMSPISADDMHGIWVMRLLLPLAFAGLVKSILERAPVPNLHEKLQSVPPFMGDICPYCKGKMLVGPIPHCDSCGIQRQIAS